MTRRSGHGPTVKRKVRTDMLHFVHWKPCGMLCAVFVFIALAANASFAQQADKTFGPTASGGAPRAIVNLNATNNGSAGGGSPNATTSRVFIGAIPARPSELAIHRQQDSGAGTLASTARSSVGAVVESSAGLKGTGIGRPGFGPGAIGGAIGNEASVGRTVSGRQSSSPVAAPGATKLRDSINGTGVGRPGSGPGSIGGAAKNASTINGTSIRPPMR